jgi:hypothetical protein
MIRDGRVTSVVPLVPALAGVTAFVVYLRTLLPGLAFGDWGEMQTVPHVLGIAHPTGYPTYLVIAWFADLVPLGSAAFRANALSALLAACAVAACAATALRLGVRPLVASGAAILLAAVGTVWAAATAAEVNALHMLFASILANRALAWDQHRRPRDLVLGGLALGLSVGNHLLTLFLAPFLVVFVLWVGRRELSRRPTLLLLAGAAVLLGMSVYLYIPVAAAFSPPLAYNHPVTLEATWWLVSGGQFRGNFDFLSAAGPASYVDSLPTLWALLVSRATLVVPSLGLIGLVVLIRCNRSFGLMLGGMLVATTYIWANYLELEHYLLGAWLVLGLGVAVALDAVARQLGRFGRDTRGPAPSRRGIAGQLVVGLISIGFAVVLAATNWTRADRSDDAGADAFVSTTWSVLPANAAILTEWDVSTPLWHAQLVRGERPDVLIVDDTNIVYDGWGSREARIASLICDRPVFMLRLKDASLVPATAEYRLTPVAEVVVGRGTATAVLRRPIHQVTPIDPRRCVD